MIVDHVVKTTVNVERCAPWEPPRIAWNNMEH